MKTRIIRIGNSRGIRIPKPLLEQAGLGDEVELRVVDSGIFIEATSCPRVGWSQAARSLHERDEDGLLDAPMRRSFPGRPQRSLEHVPGRPDDDRRAHLPVSCLMPF